MNISYTISIVIVLAALIAYLNQRFLKLPNTIGVMVISISISVVLLLSGNLYPAFFRDTIKLITAVDFDEIVIGTMLSFLLFAGTIQLRIADLKSQQITVMVFSTLSVAISTALVGIMLYGVVLLLSMPVSLLECFLFGALISPTDPVSVLGIIKEARVSKSLETKIAGESLFNDGVALVIFFSILHAIRNPSASITVASVAQVFIKEALGGLALGILLGFIGLRALKGIDHYKVEVMITLAIVMGGYSLARSLGISGPLTMVAAGIFIGNYGKSYAMSDISRDYLDKFWELIEEILNITLFVLIGFELLLIKHFDDYWQIGAICIVIVLIARFVSLAIPAVFIRTRERMGIKTVLFLTWGGLRGGISIALALSLTRGLHREMFVFITYFIVVFSVIVQGLSIERLTNRAKRKMLEDKPA
jgi:CPA1 family monovalent cation:H+ antiporter